MGPEHGVYHKTDAGTVSMSKATGTTSVPSEFVGSIEWRAEIAKRFNDSEQDNTAQPHLQ